MSARCEAALGEAARDARKIRDMGMERVSSMLRVAGLTNFYPTTISRIEGAKRPVHLHEAFLIAQCLDIDLAEIGSRCVHDIPRICPSCLNKPPSGFSCNTCGAGGAS